MTKPIITFTHEQAVAYITEKLQDNFSSDFDFIVSISNAPVEISNNPWLVPDEEGWFMHDPNWSLRSAPNYINLNKAVHIEFYDGDQTANSYAVGNFDWSVSVFPKRCQVNRWKYAD